MAKKQQPRPVKLLPRLQAPPCPRCGTPIVGAWNIFLAGFGTCPVCGRELGPGLRGWFTGSPEPQIGA